MRITVRPFFLAFTLALAALLPITLARRLDL